MPSNLLIFCRTNSAAEALLLEIASRSMLPLIAGTRLARVPILVAQFDRPLTPAESNGLQLRRNVNSVRRYPNATLPALLTPAEIIARQSRIHGSKHGHTLGPVH
jgi:hypothetical protein